MKVMANHLPKRDQKSALLLIRTPFQAFIARQVLIEEKVSSFDLLYFTQNNSSEDLYYFDLLSSGSVNAEYFYAPKRKFDILGQLDFRLQARSYFQDKNFDFVLLASIDAPVINAIASRQSAELVTLDDGSANIFSLGHYHVDSTNWRGRIYRKLLGGACLSDFKRRIARHYTLYPQFENIVEPERLRTLDGVDGQPAGRQQGSIRTYFIGAPFEEVMTASQIKVFQSYLRSQQIDYYVKHPREDHPLELDIPLLDKAGRIAEDAICRDADGADINIIGWFSTVLLNLGGLAKRRTMILFASDSGTSLMVELGKEAGCEIVML